MSLRTLASIAASCALLAVAPPAVRARHEHPDGQHGHHGAGGTVTQIQLQDGKRWPTDESLRTGMAQIRAAFDEHHPAIHAGQETDAQYAALATRIDRQVESIVAHCKLPADADANLHFVVADLLQGVSMMRGQDPARSRHDGAALVHGALNAYGKSFDDPTWQAPR